MDILNRVVHIYSSISSYLLLNIVKTHCTDFVNTCAISPLAHIEVHIVYCSCALCIVHKYGMCVCLGSSYVQVTIFKRYKMHVFHTNAENNCDIRFKYNLKNG